MLNRFLLQSSILAFSACLSQSAMAQSNQEHTEIIVTGVPRSTELRGASVSVTTLDSEEISSLVPESAAELLQEVPGVFVNSALGEIRNVVFTRGLSAGSIDGATGFFYVSMQEDSLPVTNVTATNFGPDHFLRADLGIKRVEALRGGSATVTGPNAPGGIFNFISKTGETDQGIELRARAGLEGAGQANEFYRADFYAGGEIGNSGRLFYGVSGFYRESGGPRDAGYNINEGGQIKVNLVYKGDNDRLEFHGKILNDHNAWQEFLPVTNFDKPTPIPGFDFNSSVLPPAQSGTRNNVHSFPSYDNNAQPITRIWDPRDGIHERSKAFSIKWDHDFDSGWGFSNNLKYTKNDSDWSSGAAIFAVPVNDAFAIETLLGAGGRAGTFQFKDQTTGAVLAQVDSDGNGTFTTLDASGLPNREVINGGVFTQTAFSIHPQSEEWMDQLTLSKAFTNGMAVTFGTFYAQSDLLWVSGAGGAGLGTLEPQPKLLDIELITPEGVVQQVTNEAGFSGLGKIGDLNNTFNFDVQKQFSAFFGYEWEITEKLKFDVGARYENIRHRGFNRTAVRDPRSNDLTFGGLDGDPNTIFDNTLQSFSDPILFNKSIDFFAYSPAISYRWNDQNSTYIRFSKGRKAPDSQTFFNIDSADEARFTPDQITAQRITQLELGYQHTSRLAIVTVTPFYTKVKRIDAVGVAVFEDDQGVTFSPPLALSDLETYGAEFDASIDPTPGVNLHAVGLWQHSRSQNFGFFTHTRGQTRDTVAFVSTPNGRPDGTPKIITNTTLTVRPYDVMQASETGIFQNLTFYGSWQFMGNRAANRANIFNLASYNVWDFGLNFDVGDDVSINLNMKNAFNSHGTINWSPAGGFIQSLDRQRPTAADIAADPNQQFNVLQIPPRAVFMAVSVKL